MNWPRVHLGDVIKKIEGGGTPSKEKPEYWQGQIPWASVKDIVTHNPYGTIDHISAEGLQKSSSRLIKAGTLITPTRMALGHAVFFEIDVAINQDLKAIYPNDELDKEYLYYWFQQNKKRIERLGTGSTVSGIQLSELRSQKINLPPIDEQKKIVTILKCADSELAKITVKEQAVMKQKQYLLKNLISGAICIPENSR